MDSDIKVFGRKEKSYQFCCFKCGVQYPLRTSPATAAWDRDCHTCY